MRSTAACNDPGHRAPSIRLPVTMLPSPCSGPTAVRARDQRLTAIGLRGMRSVKLFLLVGRDGAVSGGVRDASQHVSLLHLR